MSYCYPSQLWRVTSRWIPGTQPTGNPSYPTCQAGRFPVSERLCPKNKVAISWGTIPEVVISSAITCMYMCASPCEHACNPAQKGKDRLAMLVPVWQVVVPWKAANEMGLKQLKVLTDNIQWLKVFGFVFPLCISMCFQKYNQEKHALQREVELKSRMLDSLSCECEALKQQQKAQLEQLEVQLHRSHRQEVSDLKNKVCVCSE